MKKIITLTAAALMSVAAVSTASAGEKMMDSQLHQAAAAKYAFARYVRKAPNSSFQKFLEDNPHLVQQLGTVTPETELPAGTIYYLPLHSRNTSS